MSWTLPPIAATSPTKTPGKMSRLAVMQARFQARQMAEKEEKLINLLETREEETMQRATYGRSSVNSFNSYSSSNSNNSMNGSVGARPTMQQNTPGRVRQMFEERRAQVAQDDRKEYYRNNPGGWEKGYHMDSVEAINKEVRVPVYKQSVTRINTNNKYSGNYGPKSGQNANMRGNCNSLDRRINRGGSQYSNISNGLPRARSHANIIRTASSEESSLSSRPPSGIGYNYQKNSKSTQKQNGNLMLSGNMRYSNYQESPEDEILSQKSSVKSQNNYYQGGTRDYTRPTPPSYNRRGSTSTNRDISVGRTQISYHDTSPYSSHSSDQSSDPPGFSVIPRRASVHGSRESLLPHTAPLSSPKKNYKQSISRENSFCRQNSFSQETEEQNNRINNRTFRKQKSPWRRTGRNSTSSPNRSPDHSDETDITNSSDYEMRVATRAGGVEREEERRRLKIEMRKREQELLAKIIQQQKELETVKTQKSKVEKELEMQEKQREKERQALEEKERQLFEEQERRIQEEQEKINREKYERRQQEEKLKRTSSIRRRQLPSDARSLNEKEKQLCEEQEIPKQEERLRRNSSIRRRQIPSDTRNLHEKASSNGHKAPLLSRVERAPSADKGDTEEKVMKPSYITNNTKNQINIEIKSAERNPPATPQNFRKNTKNIEATLPMTKNNNKHTTNDKPAIRKDTTVVRRSVFAPKEQDGLEQCTNCGRNFATDRISKHTEICIKTSKKKRKTFDMTKARVTGTDAQAFVKNKAQLQRKEAQKAKPKPKSDWRKKREEFINALRIAKETQRHIANGGKASDLPPPPPTDNSDYVQCPYCKRRFNDAAAERHIPKCKDIKSNKKR